jgi:peptidase E
METQIIGSSSGGIALDRYILKQCQHATPKVCFLPHAPADPVAASLSFYEKFSKFDAKLSTLSLFAPHTPDLEGFLLEQDIIYVAGGNTRSMLALWREWELDSFLTKAYHNGTILTGISAGAICWFEHAFSQTVQDCRALKGLGILQGILNVHQKKEGTPRQESFERIVDQYSVGYGLEDHTALHFKNGVLYKALSVDETSTGYIHRGDRKEELVMERIGDSPK